MLTVNLKQCFLNSDKMIVCHCCFADGCWDQHAMHLFNTFFFQDDKNSNVKLNECLY